jgi:hypothetical protein
MHLLSEGRSNAPEDRSSRAAFIPSLTSEPPLSLCHREKEFRATSMIRDVCWVAAWTNSSARDTPAEREITVLSTVL